MNAVATNCQIIADQLEAYLDHKLDADASATVEAHLEVCSDCHDCIQYSRAVHGLLEYIQIDPRAALREQEPEVGFFARLHSTISAAPWWGVSVALHALVIMLAGLLSMSVKLPLSEDSVIMVTELQQRQLGPEVKQDLARNDSALESKLPVNATDPVSKEQSNIVVPQDILQRAELGDHFETVNPDRPDTQSAFGNADAEMFHSVRGDDSPAGGGGDNGAFLETLIGVGGGAGVGSGGGFGGGDGTGIGLGKGSGTGSFGNRNGAGRKLMIKRHGGNAGTESAVNAALRWLAYHQEADGHWDAAKYGGGMIHGNRAANVDVAVTGLSVLAFLGAGHTEKVGEFRDNVKRGVAWLISKQEENGRIFDGGRGYSCAIATLALAEAAGMANIKETRAAAQKAVNYCTDIHQCGEGSDKRGWRYSAKQEGDLSVTGWFIMALKSAKVAGLKVDPMSLDGAIRFLDSVEVSEDASGYPVKYYGYTGPARERLRTTCIGLLCRQFLGWKKEELQPSVQSLVNRHVPAWGTGGKSVDLYYWYYGSLCTFQQGGDIWNRWNEAMKKALGDNQRKDGDEAGSWDIVGDFSQDWGRVGQTALGALCLEVYYRYAQIQKD